MEPAQLPPPEYCDACASVNIEFREHEKRRGHYVWSCLDCKASVGAHKGTRSPFGFMADSETRLLRAQAHAAFDDLWRPVEGVRGPYMDRTKAYRWLSHALDVPVDNCHISNLTQDQLRLTIELSKERAEVLERARQRRSKKKRVKRMEDAKRERVHIGIRKDSPRKNLR